MAGGASTTLVAVGAVEGDLLGPDRHPAAGTWSGRSGRRSRALARSRRRPVPRTWTSEDVHTGVPTVGVDWPLVDELAHHDRSVAVGHGRRHACDLRALAAPPVERGEDGAVRTRALAGEDRVAAGLGHRRRVDVPEQLHAPPVDLGSGRRARAVDDLVAEVVAGRDPGHPREPPRVGPGLEALLGGDGLGRERGVHDHLGRLAGVARTRRRRRRRRHTASGASGHELDDALADRLRRPRHRRAAVM